LNTVQREGEEHGALRCYATPTEAQRRARGTNVHNNIAHTDAQPIDVVSVVDEENRRAARIGAGGDSDSIVGVNVEYNHVEIGQEGSQGGYATSRRKIVDSMNTQCGGCNKRLGNHEPALVSEDHGVVA
jgi:hypothetical protein